MNFIVIVSDTLRRDFLGCYGNEWISTPHIDRFAAGAQVFDRAYSLSFPTVPHRRDLFTGRFTATYTGWAPLGPDEVVLAQVLSDAGYTTMMIADCPHILEAGYYYERGFDGWEWIRGQESDRWKTSPEAPASPCDPTKTRNPSLLARQHRRAAAHWRYEKDRFVARTMATACEWLEDNYRHEKFFLYVDTFDPHEPWDAPQWYVDMYNPGYAGEVVDYPHYAYTKDFLTEAELKHCRALYAAEVSLVDRWTGRLLDRIGDLGLLDDTMVLFTTDHGFLHGEHGIMGKALIGTDDVFRYIPLYEEINHIPLVVHLPGGAAARREAVVQPFDVMPTMLELAGVEIPETVHGKSFAGVLRGKGDTHREFAVSSPNVKEAIAVATVVKGRWAAAIRPKYGTDEKAPDSAVDGRPKTQAAADKAADLLFDVEADPAQAHDVAAKNPKVLAELRADFVATLEAAGTDPASVDAWRA
jgi:arylsulfatase A-like enzyme